MPVAVFGRTGAVQDALYTLVGGPATVSVIEVGFFDDQAAIAFVEAQLRLTRPDTTHQDAELKVISAILAKLRQQTASDGDRFAGYAPVLRAVAQFVSGEANAYALLSQVETKGSITLGTVVDLILDRDQVKLRPLPFSDDTLRQRLYGCEEQLDRCVAKVFGASMPTLPAMSAADMAVYQNALETWMVDHPFLLNSNPSSVVFDAALTVRALKRPDTCAVALERQLARGAAANPFLFEFYYPDGYVEYARLPPEHIGLIYSSIRAGLGRDDTASLTIDGEEDAETEEDAAFKASVEVTVQRAGKERADTLRFSSNQLQTIWLTSHVQDVEIDVAHATVDIGPGPGITLSAPVSIQCDFLSLRAETVTAEAMVGDHPGAIYLEAARFAGAGISSVPSLRGGVALRVSWPDCRTFPWTAFASSPTQVADPRLMEGLRRLRRFVMAFRSHSKGALARLRDKLEHSRMTKGAGKRILDHLISKKIVQEHGKMYYLNSSLLGTISGSTYSDCVAREFKPKTTEFVECALKTSED